MEKVFLVLRGYQDSIILADEIELDETYYKVRKGDIQRQGNGNEYRGLSRNQLCIGVACDKHRVICFVEGAGKPSRQRTLDTFKTRIKPGSTLIHDIEKSHNALIEDLGLESIVFDARQLMNIPDSENPLNRVNQYCRMLKRFLNAHSGFIRKDLQDYLNLFSFIMNEPQDKHQKVEEFIIRAVSCRITHRYRS